MKVVIFVALCVAVAVAQMQKPSCGLAEDRCKQLMDCVMSQLKSSPPSRPAAGVTPSAAEMAAGKAAHDTAMNSCFSSLGFTDAERTTVQNNRPQGPPRGQRPAGAPTGVAATSG